MSKPANPFELFLGVNMNPEKPDYYRLFSVDRKSVSPHEIQLAADKVIAKVRAQKPGEHKKEWAWLLDQLNRAKKAMIKKSGQARQGQDRKKPITSAAQVNAYDPPSVKPVSPERKVKSGANRALQTTGNQSESKPAKTDPAKPADTVAKAGTERAKADTEKTQQKPTSVNVADPPMPSANHKSDRSRTVPSTKQSSSKKLTRESGKPTAKTKNNSTSEHADQSAMSFSLAAPDEPDPMPVNDSCESDTHLSGSSLQPEGGIAPTIDPMAPVGDPTAEWDSFDISTIDDNGYCAQAVATKPRMTQSSIPATETVPSSRTFYGESYRKKSKVGLMIGGTLLAMAVVGVVSWAIIFGFRGSDSDHKQVAENNGSGVASGDGVSENGDTKKNKASENDNAQPPATDGGAEKKSPDSQQPKTDGPMKNPDSPSKEKSEPKKNEPGQDSNPEKKNPPDKGTEPKKGNDPEPEKKGPDGEKMEPAKPRNSDIAELSGILTQIREKLVERNLVDAERLLKKAEELPKTEEHAAMVDRLRRVTDLYVEFWDKVVEGCGKLKGLDEIKFSETNIVKVVESSEERIVYRALGQRFEKEPRQLQIGLAMKIAEKEFDAKSAEGLLIKGAVFAIDAFNNPDRAVEARNFWEDAKLLGTDTDPLIAFLDDRYDDLLSSVIQKAKLPDEKSKEEAQKRFREKYADLIKTASRNQKNASAFAEQLLKDVPAMDDPADRHANFVAAIFYAGKFGDVETVMTAISDMNKWFSIDMEQQTLDALTKMNKGRLKPDQKREIARTAFEYMDRAKAAQNIEQELKFAELALAAAKGTRDSRLIQTATREVQRIKATMSQPNPGQ